MIMARQPTIPRKCRYCGKDFLALSDNVKQGHGNYCSRACVQALRSKQADEKRPAQFLTKFTENTDGCWVWNNVPGSHGYGEMHTGHRVVVLAHRYAYEVFVGPISEGLQIDHLCRNRRCVNPAHLEAVTPRENTVRGFAARRAGEE